MVATFASLISRIQQVINAAERYDRKVAVVGRSMVNNVKMALNMGYLDADDGTVVSLSQARQLPLDEVVIVATGSQGEPTSALVRIANGEHQDIEVVPGDTVVISASPIPGNETVVAKTIDNLFRQGAEVLHSRIALVHVHGHASREELKMMLGLVKPTFFVPVHGEYRHLVAHASIARSMGVEESNAFVLEDGDVLELTPDSGEVTERVPTGQVYVDGRRVLDRHSTVLEERRRLGREGVVTVGITLDSRNGDVVGAPDVASFGFLESDESRDIFQKTSKLVRSTLEQDKATTLRLDEIKALVGDSVARFLHKETRRRPTVLTVIDEV
jgi:ribonuclease J